MALPQMQWGILRDESFFGLVDKKRKGKDVKEAKKKENPPTSDRIPLPNLPESVRQERRLSVKETNKKIRIGTENPPSVCLYTILNAPNGVCCASLSENCEMAAIGYGNSSIQLRSINQKGFRKLKTSAELDLLDNEHDDYVDEIYDDSTRSDMLEFNGHLGPVYSTSFSPDRKLLLSASRDQTVRLWSLDIQRNVVTYRMDAPVWQAQFCSRGFYFAATTASKCVSLYSTERVFPLRIFTEAKNDVTCIDFHPNCNYIIGGSDDKNIRVWDVCDGACIRTLSGHKAAVHSVKVSPDGRYLMSASRDGTICTWDLGQQKLLCVQECGPMYNRIPIVFSKDGSTVAVGAPEHSITFYNFESIIGSDFSGEETRVNPDGFTITTYPTKRTSLLDLHFARKNTIVGIGAFDQ